MATYLEWFLPASIYCISVSDDQNMHINTAMFEQNAHCGYVLKPSSFREKTTSLPFNPFGRDFDGLKPTTLTIHVSQSLYSTVNISVVIAYKFCSLNHVIRAKKRPKTINRDTTHVNNEKCLYYVASRVGQI